jgi:hypothetical protein
MQAMRPSETMTVDTLAAEIRRQADYHAGQDYPFPALTLEARAMDSKGRRGQVKITSEPAPYQVIVIVNDGTASQMVLTRHGFKPQAESVAEWSAAMHAIGPFLPEAEEAPLAAVVTVDWQ